MARRLICFCGPSGRNTYQIAGSLEYSPPPGRRGAAPFRQSFWSPWLFLDDVPTRREVFHHCYERRNTISLPAQAAFSDRNRVV